VARRQPVDTRAVNSARRTVMSEMRAKRYNKAVAEWIKSAAIPLATFEPQRGFKDLQALRSILGAARIVSLGEATHGTREFFKLKHRLLEFCVAELGFTMLGLEAGFPESLSVNAYVLNGIGNAADALAGLRYWVWDTEELLDVVEWMRWWNDSNSRKVKFYGFVATSPTVAALGLIDFLARVAPDLAAGCRNELAPLTSDLTANLFGQLPDARQRSMLACIAHVLADFDHQRPQWMAATSVTDWHLGRLHATVLERGARFALEPRSADHDRAMAENVCALMEAEGPDANAVLWSHNAHAERAIWSEDNNSMGKYLDATVGRAQVVCGFSFDQGSFQARAYPSGGLIDHSVTAAEPNSFDSALAQAGLPLFALDFVNAPRDGSVGEWLSSKIAMRSIGGIYGFPKDNRYGVTYTDVIIPREYFDVILFVAQTTAAHRTRPILPSAVSVALSAPVNLELSGDGIPAGWQIVGADRRYAYAIAVSEQASPRGGRTVRMSREAPWLWGDGQLVQKISAEAWHGKRVRFAAAIRTAVRDVGSGALLSLKFLAKSDPIDEPDFFATTEIAVTASVEQPVQSPEWATFAVEADVPATAHTVVISLAMTGNGIAWFGDLEFSVHTRGRDEANTLDALGRAAEATALREP